MFNRQIGFTFFKIGDGQVIVGRGKIRIDFKVDRCVLRNAPANADTHIRIGAPGSQRFHGGIIGRIRLAGRQRRYDLEVAAGIDALQDFVRRHPGDLIGRLRLGAALLQEERYDEAEEHFEEALGMFPEYGEADSPYWYLALIHQERGELERAAAALQRLNELSESNYRALVMQADLLEELERPAEAADALRKAVLIWPYEMELHQRLASLSAEIGDTAGALTERQAVLALQPADRAEAHYLLAIAQRDAGEATAARRSVLRALEVAPNYAAALELLLELRGGN